MKHIEKVEKWLSILANFAVVLGVVFAVYQFNELRKFEKKSNAIKVIERTREPEFLRSFQVISQNMRNGEKDRNRVLEDLNQIANTYDYIAVLYFSENVDKELIMHSTEEAVLSLSDIFDYYEYPSNRLKNFNKLKKEINEDK